MASNIARIIRTLWWAVVLLLPTTIDAGGVHRDAATRAEERTPSSSSSSSSPPLRLRGGRGSGGLHRAISRRASSPSAVVVEPKEDEEADEHQFYDRRTGEEKEEDEWGRSSSPFFSTAGGISSSRRLRKDDLLMMSLPMEAAVEEEEEEEASEAGPPSSSSLSSSGSNCPPAYDPSEASSYSEGTLVESNGTGRVFRCNPFPYELYCTVESYRPMSEEEPTMWRDVWEELYACDMPSASPSTATPTGRPSDRPSSEPSSTPTRFPSPSPSTSPSSPPSDRPSSKPSSSPTLFPTPSPSASPSDSPSTSSRPSPRSSDRPSNRPSSEPSGRPSSRPSISPSTTPSSSTVPTQERTMHPSLEPTARESDKPSSVKVVPSSYPSTSSPTSKHAPASEQGFSEESAGDFPPPPADGPRRVRTSIRLEPRRLSSELSDEGVLVFERSCASFLEGESASASSSSSSSFDDVACVIASQRKALFAKGRLGYRLGDSSSVLLDVEVEGDVAVVAGTKADAAASDADLFDDFVREAFAVRGDQFADALRADGERVTSDFEDVTEVLVHDDKEGAENATTTKGGATNDKKSLGGKGKGALWGSVGAAAVAIAVAGIAHRVRSDRSEPEDEPRPFVGERTKGCYDGDYVDDDNFDFEHKGYSFDSVGSPPGLIAGGSNETDDDEEPMRQVYTFDSPSQPSRILEETKCSDYSCESPLKLDVFVMPDVAEERANRDGCVGCSSGTRPAVDPSEEEAGGGGDRPDEESRDGRSASATFMRIRSLDPTPPSAVSGPRPRPVDDFPPTEPAECAPEVISPLSGFHSATRFRDDSPASAGILADLSAAEAAVPGFVYGPRSRRSVAGVSRPSAVAVTTPSQERRTPTRKGSSPSLTPTRMGPVPSLTPTRKGPAPLLTPSSRDSRTTPRKGPAPLTPPPLLPSSRDRRTTPRRTRPDPLTPPSALSRGTTRHRSDAGLPPAGPPRGGAPSSSDVAGVRSLSPAGEAMEAALSRNRGQVKVRRCVVAPPGRLGIIVKQSTQGCMIHSVKPGSSVEGLLFGEDLIVSFNDEDVSRYTARQLTLLIAENVDAEKEFVVLSRKHGPTPFLVRGSSIRR